MVSVVQYIYNYTVTGNMDKVNAWKNENYVVDEKFKTLIAAIPLLTGMQNCGYMLYVDPFPAIQLNPTGSGTPILIFPISAGINQISFNF